MNRSNLHEQQESSAPKGVVLGFLKDVLETVIPAVAIALLITHFVGERTFVQGLSMEPNLSTGQSLIMDKLSYRFQMPQRGDIVVFEMEGYPSHFIKRLVGLPGETLEIRNNQVFINGHPLDEPYLGNVTQWDFGPVQIPDGQIFAMGDNRNVSHDCRAMGPAPLENVTGRAIFALWPIDQFGPLP